MYILLLVLNLWGCATVADRAAEKAIDTWKMEAPDYDAPEHIREVKKEAMPQECVGYQDGWLGCAYRLPDSFLIVIMAGLPDWLHDCVLKHERRHKHEGHDIAERRPIFDFCNEG